MRTFIVSLAIVLAPTTVGTPMAMVRAPHGVLIDSHPLVFNPRTGGDDPGIGKLDGGVQSFQSVSGQSIHSDDQIGINSLRHTLDYLAGFYAGKPPITPRRERRYPAESLSG